ncbi:3-hydroxyacyl-CoA dehydrogenase NAD-binding domain-containing protein [Limnohabitans sp. Rim8]|jgi:3-hydroxybutyryl-CoA dehydrogenase|uniref:3-hydroxyacyl-CoA dehydrogenase family protein n=1 Tax=Limnohabitans sp. Rim8 TaxID=1100718 RepID=UPI0025D32612|nr:3-hydroxyacyl-CoA dehydrogenase NAD-binding domain-containing protein [Limnohabitans sp. Rim8]
MAQPSIRTVLVAGAGSIGIGVARSMRSEGYRTLILSRNPARLQGQVEGVELISQLPVEAPDLVVECLPELIELKHRFYAEVESAWSGAPILATNTSSLSFEELARPLVHPARFVGMHYMYPAHQRELFVEVIRIAGTSDEVVESVLQCLERCGKKAVVLNRPVIGALFNRLQHALLREAYYLIDQGVATPEQIDDMARQFIAPRMCITGLLQQKDINGLDTHTYAQRSLRPMLCNDPQPSQVLEQHFARGEFGLKTGRGFYDWTGADSAAIRLATEKNVARITALIRQIKAGD